MYSDAFLADTRIDADAVNTVTIKVKVWIDFSQMTLKRPDPSMPMKLFSLK